MEVLDCREELGYILNSQGGLRVKRNVEILEKRGVDEGYHFLEICTIASECEFREAGEHGASDPGIPKLPLCVSKTERGKEAG